MENKIESALLSAGAEGVLRYREMSRQPDNALPEVFLNGFIASRLYECFGLPTRIQEPYTSFVSAKHTSDMLKEIGGQTADIAMFQNEGPPIIVELKIFDERNSLQKILDDQLKLNKLTHFGRVVAYAGIVICETTNSALIDRIASVQDGLGRTVSTSPTQVSPFGEWEWCFGIARLTN